jgi:hypothetical protein
VHVNPAKKRQCKEISRRLKTMGKNATVIEWTYRKAWVILKQIGYAKGYENHV